MAAPSRHGCGYRDHGDAARRFLLPGCGTCAAHDPLSCATLPQWHRTHLLRARVQCSTSASTRTRAALRAAPTRAFVYLTATPSSRLTGAVRAPAPLPQYTLPQLVHGLTLWVCAVQTSPMAGSGSWRCSSDATSWHWWAAGATRATRRTRSWCGTTTRTAVSVRLSFAAASLHALPPDRRVCSPPPHEVAAAARATQPFPRVGLSAASPSPHPHAHPNPNPNPKPNPNQASSRSVRRSRRCA